METIDSANRYHLRLLESELARRKRVNLSYSLRAFARGLNVDASTLSRILRGKQEISDTACVEIIRRLRLEKEEQARFIASVAEDRRIRTLNYLNQAIQKQA